MGSPYGHLPYRRGVGVMLLNRDGHVWVGRRIDTPDAWQMPQGGIDDEDSDILAAARRELAEETGITSIETLGLTRDWLRYDLPAEKVPVTWGGKYRGQEQMWLAARFTGAEDEIRLDAHHAPEFDAWRWVPMPEVPSLIVPFKRPLYENLVAEFSCFVP